MDIEKLKQLIQDVHQYMVKNKEFDSYKGLKAKLKKGLDLIEKQQDNV